MRKALELITKKATTDANCWSGVIDGVREIAQAALGEGPVPISVTREGLIEDFLHVFHKAGFDVLTRSLSELVVDALLSKFIITKKEGE